MRYLFRKGLEANMRSRYIYLSWGLWEKAQGLPDNARRLFKRGHELNPQDAPILQVCARAPQFVMQQHYHLPCDGR